jgi:hypothetical protein
VVSATDPQKVYPNEEDGPEVALTDRLAGFFDGILYLLMFTIKQSCT